MKSSRYSVPTTQRGDQCPRHQEGVTDGSLEDDSEVTAVGPLSNGALCCSLSVSSRSVSAGLALIADIIAKIHGATLISCNYYARACNNPTVIPVQHQNTRPLLLVQRDILVPSNIHEKI
eukprot:scaffold1763_cov181-Amphora_coffeaeformis.AAC.8